MAQFLYLVTILFIITLSSVQSKDHFSWFPALFRPFITPTSICANNITQNAYLNKTLTLINNFQSNATYNSILQVQSPNFVAYLKNSTNQGLLHSNCPVFITGVKAAKSVDNAAERTRQRINQEIQQRFQQIPHDVTGSNGPNDLDSGDLYGHRH